MTVSGNGRLCAIVDISHSGGHCFTAPTPADAPQGDDLDRPDHSSLRVFEDGGELGPPHSLHKDISLEGGGRFSHWGRELMFSSSDGSDPRTNGRSYRMLYLLQRDPQIGVLTAALNLNIGALAAEERYAWAERVFSVLAPNVKLSEYGRSIFADTDFLADYERFDRQQLPQLRSQVRHEGTVETRASARRRCCRVRSFSRRQRLFSCQGNRGRAARQASAPVSTHSPDCPNQGPISTARTGIPATWLAASLRSPQTSRNMRAASLSMRAGFPKNLLRLPTRNSASSTSTSIFTSRRAMRWPSSDRGTVSGGLIVCDDYGFETCPAPAAPWTNMRPRAARPSCICRPVRAS